MAIMTTVVAMEVVAVVAAVENLVITGSDTLRTPIDTVLDGSIAS